MLYQPITPKKSLAIHISLHIPIPFTEKKEKVPHTTNLDYALLSPPLACFDFSTFA